MMRKWRAKRSMQKKVLVLRNCRADMTSYNGFRWPEKGPVECPDWNPKLTCSGGLFGLLWGRGGWSLLDDSPDAVWQVVEVDADCIVDIDNQMVKFPRGNVIYSGHMAEAISTVLCHPDAMKTADHVASGYSSAAASSGEGSSAASSGNFSTAASSGEWSITASNGQRSASASSGERSRAASSGEVSTAASSGEYSVASSSGDYSGAASTGNFSIAASSGYDSTSASGGYRSTAVSSGVCSRAASSGNYSKAIAQGENTIAMAAGTDCIVSAGENGCFASAWYDPNTKRNRIKVGHVGEDGIKANTPYKLTQDGQWEEVRDI